MNVQKTILVWQYDDAPDMYKNAATIISGEEAWLAFVPNTMQDVYIPWLEYGNFGSQEITQYSVNGGTVYIGHA